MRVAVPWGWLLSQRSCQFSIKKGAKEKIFLTDFRFPGGNGIWNKFAHSCIFVCWELEIRLEIISFTTLSRSSVCFFPTSFSIFYRQNYTMLGEKLGISKWERAGLQNSQKGIYIKNYFNYAIGFVFIEKFYSVLPNCLGNFSKLEGSRENCIWVNMAMIYL